MNLDYKEESIKNLKINHLYINGIYDERIIDVILRYNRKLFLPKELHYLANIDGPIFYQDNRFLIEISTIGYMIKIANLQEKDNVLVIGASLGYATSIISTLVEKVIALESDEVLIERSKEVLRELNINNIDFVNDSLTEAKIEKNFNKIILEGATSSYDFDIFKNLSNNVEIITVERKDNLSQIVKLVKINGKLVKKFYKNTSTPYLIGFEEKDNFIF